MLSLSNRLMLTITASALCCCLFNISAVKADLAATNPVAPGATAAAGGPYTLKYKFVVGQSNKYSSSVDTVTQTAMAGATQPMAMHMGMTMEQTVQSVDPTTGTATEKVTIGGMSGTMNGQPLPITPQQAKTTAIVTVSPAGQTTMDPTSAPSMQMPGMTGPGGMGMTSMLPKNPVNIGDTWTASMPIGILAVNLNFKNTLKSVTLVNGDSIATIESDFSSTPGIRASSAPPAMANMLSTFGGVMLTSFDITTGVADSVSSNMIMDMSSSLPSNAGSGQMHMHMNVDMKMALLPPTTN